MKFIELLELANEAYSDGFLMEAYKGEGVPVDLKCGDTLASFLVIELKETFDPDASDQKQLETAHHAVFMAQAELSAICTALERRLSALSA
jgi:hypothetical protein